MIALLVVLAAAPASGLTPIHVTSTEFEAFNKPADARKAVWSGKVVARRGDVTIRCDRLTADLAQDDKLKRLVCEGKVEAEQGTRWVAGDRAEFDNARGVLTVTGSPRARDGASEATGEVITFYVDEDRIHVTKPKMVVRDKDLQRERKKR